MSSLRILYVCQEIVPYLPESDMGSLCRKLIQSMQEKGNEIRTFMPRYGVINERRNQLHEVIRLSGMNLIINDNDHQLIIKVASIPSARIQVYFIDNDDYFLRKGITVNPSDGKPYEDNDERSIFFARGVIETVRKLRWEPQVVHCHGWISSVIPIYMKSVFADDPLFANVRIVASIYGEGFTGTMDAGFKSKIEAEGVKDPRLGIISDPTYQNLMKLVIDYADGIIIETQSLDGSVRDYLQQSGKKYLDYHDKNTDDYIDTYNSFYESLL